MNIPNLSLNRERVVPDDDDDESRSLVGSDITSTFKISSHKLDLDGSTSEPTLTSEAPSGVNMGGGIDIQAILSNVYKVYFRDEFVKPDSVDEDIETAAMNLESALYTAKVEYQQLSVKNDDIPYIQMLCNDKAEQKKLQQILLKQKFVLCFEQG